MPACSEILNQSTNIYGNPQISFNIRMTYTYDCRILNTVLKLNAM